MPLQTCRQLALIVDRFICSSRGDMNFTFVLVRVPGLIGPDLFFIYLLFVCFFF